MNSLFFFIIAIAILVVVHEFGHFWVAKRCGVKVLTFSVGFGKKLWSRRGKDGTEYVIAAIPLGGYVKMLDEREGEVEASELAYTFNRKPLMARVAIVLAGPLANLLFAVLAFWLIFLLGIPGVKPLIENVIADSPAEYSQLIVGDEIVSINGYKTSTISEVNRVLSQFEKNHEIELVTLGNNKQTTHILDLKSLDNKQDAIEPPVSLEQLGISPVQPIIRPIIGEVIAGSPASLAGLKKGDELISHNEKRIDNWVDWVTLIRASKGIPLTISLLREGVTQNITITPELSEEGHVRIGASVDTSVLTMSEALKSTQHYSILTSLSMAVTKTWDFSWSTVTSIAGMITGHVSAENIGGPISIAQFAGQSAEYGLTAFISFLAMISISLGILNLLPIPMLDGGHLFFYIIEWIRGKPLSSEVQIKAQNIGMILLMMLMIIAFSNDLSRLFG